MRQLLISWPPRIVSWKWTLQLSCGSRLPSAAAIPPSAMTVCALPSNDLQTTATSAPIAEASMAARRPAPPAPITRTSWLWTLYGSVTESSWGHEDAGNQWRDGDDGGDDGNLLS